MVAQARIIKQFEWQRWRQVRNVDWLGFGICVLEGEGQPVTLGEEMLVN